MQRFLVRLLVAPLLCGCLSASAWAFADSALVGAWNWDAHWQITSIPMVHGPFPEDYSGPDSLRDRTEVDASLTSTLFLGLQVLPGLQVYADPEVYGGSGFSDTMGIAGFPNGEIYHVSNPSLHPDLARLYIQGTLGWGSASEVLPEGQNQIVGRVPLSRVTVAAGKFALTDFFDDNTFSHDARNQFLNLALMDVGSWDCAADTEGYTEAGYLEWDEARWTARFAEAGMPTQPNGPDLDQDLDRSRSENAELDVPWGSDGGAGALRFLAYWNHGDMGNYRTTLLDPADAMDVNRSAAPSTLKDGFGLNLEQALGGANGLFARLGWDPGDQETFAFTAIDRCASAGAQLDGALWGRASDRAGLGWALDGLNPAHAEYLARGGTDFIVGDGALDYGLELDVEAYYDFSLCTGLSLTPDFQFVKNPAYNQDRGPVEIYGLRAHFEI